MARRKHNCLWAGLFVGIKQAKNCKEVHSRLMIKIRICFVRHLKFGDWVAHAQEKEEQDDEKKSDSCYVPISTVASEARNSNYKYPK